MASNLPPQTDLTDSAASTKQIFNNYGQQPDEFRAIDVDSSIAFFKKRGFDDQAAESVAMILLKQAKTEKVSIMAVLDSIDDTDDVQLSQIVSQILNDNRVQTSVLGYKQPVTVTSKTRNILE